MNIVTTPIEYTGQSYRVTLEMQISSDSEGNVSFLNYRCSDWGAYKVSTSSAGKFRVFFGTTADKVACFKGLLGFQCTYFSSVTNSFDGPSFSHVITEDNCTDPVNPYIEFATYKLTAGGTVEFPTIEFEPVYLTPDIGYYLTFVFKNSDLVG